MTSITLHSLVPICPNDIESAYDIFYLCKNDSLQMKKTTPHNQVKIKTALKKFIKKLEQTNDKSVSKKSRASASPAKTNYKTKNLLKGHNQAK